MDIRDIDGLWCDDITFCQNECERIDCPRNKNNIRDKRVPHSFSVETPADCLKKAEKEMACRIFDDVGNIVDEITTKVAETQDEFIFQTISKWWNNKTQMLISKRELIDALTLHKNLVRCKDCKHRDEANSPFWELWCKRNDRCVDSTWFCADGEREGR